MPSPRVTATNLAVHAHLQCDLYLHQSYYGVCSSEQSDVQHPKPLAAVTLAAFTSGNAWESALFVHLDQAGLLVRNSGPPLSGVEIASIIELDERPHFFVAGIEFWPPRHKLIAEYAKHGVKSKDVPHFGLAKPDLVEIWREDNRRFVWRIIDAKASKNVKASHLIQTYFYYLCLKIMLPSSFIPAPTTAIWLPSGSVSASDLSAISPSLLTPHLTPISPLIAPLTDLVFIRLPTILTSRRSEVSWHFNPLCRSCPFSSTCRTRVEKEQGLGKAGEVTLREADVIREFMKLSQMLPKTAAPSHRHPEAEIEDLVPRTDGLSVRTITKNQDSRSELALLAGLVGDEKTMISMVKIWPASVKRVYHILGMQHANKHFPRSTSGNHNTTGIHSPVVEAALTDLPQITNRRVYTMPSSEDIAIYLSLIIDPSQPASSSITKFCVSTQVSASFQTTARRYGFAPPPHDHGSIEALVPTLSKCIRGILDLHAQMLLGLDDQISGAEERGDNRSHRGTKNLPGTQFYMWSSLEKESLQQHLVNCALGHMGIQSTDKNKCIVYAGDIRLCIGALCEGASLLATTFQPSVLDGALLGFLGKRGQGKPEMRAIMQRLGIELTAEETVEAMRQKIVSKIEGLGADGMQQRREERRTVGLLPRVVVLKKELRRLVAIPVPGWWDVKEAALGLGVTNAIRCPDEEELFRRYWQGETAALKTGIEARNNTCQELVGELRRQILNLRGTTSELLANRARVLTAEWVDVCGVEVLRKLFYMQQFEVLLKLQALWDARIEGCPDAPLLLYGSTTSASGSQINDGQGVDNKSVVLFHNFDLIAGNLEVAPDRDRDRAFFDFILVEESDECDQSDQPKHENHLPLEALFDDLRVSGLVFPLNRYTHSKWEEGQAPEVKNGRLWVADINDVKIEGKKTQVVLRTWSGAGSKKALVPGKTYRLSPRLVDFNTTKVLSTLVELDLQVEHTPLSRPALPPFVQLISNPKSFGGHDPIHDGQEELRHKVILHAEASFHRLYTELRDLGNGNAGALVLKASQRRAARRILSERLTVIWGPPGSGKSYTIALSLLRMLEVQARTRTLTPEQRQIIFVTAMTHAAIQACLSKLHDIIDHYHRVPDLSLEWLDELKLEHILTGSTHPNQPSSIRKANTDIRSKLKTWIYVGTVYQLYTFGKRLGQSVDCIVIDEAGQLGLGAVSLVLRALSGADGIWSGKVVVAGDREQLAPILSGKYPEMGLEQPLLFGSVLDCLMGRDDWDGVADGTGVTTPEDKSAGTMVQLLENFRLNPDLGNFVQTIYKRAFKPQKVQAKLVAIQLRRLEEESSSDVVMEKARQLLLALSNAMIGKEQALFRPPSKQDTARQGTERLISDDHGICADPTATPRPISLAMVRLCVKGDAQQYESHVRAEARVAATLVSLLRKACGAEAGEQADGIFVACPHRVQRAAVKLALGRWEGENEDKDEELQKLIRDMRVEGDEQGEKDLPKTVKRTKMCPIRVTVDTIERLQGSEASFVICLFSHTHHGSLATALPFLLTRRRLNVAISRAKTLCIVISSDGVLQPGVSVFSDRESARGYAFLRAFEERAWNTKIDVELEEY